MLIREFFIMAFEDMQELKEQGPEELRHLTLLGYMSVTPGATPRYSIPEHVERIKLRRMELPGKKLRRLGRYMVTILDDEAGELRAFQKELLEALLADGYRCSRPDFYTEDRYKPHVSVGRVVPNGSQPRKLNKFAVTNVTVTESRFNRNYDFQGSEVLYVKAL